MAAEFRDLERKHQMVKEQYEAEIMRLKEQTSPGATPIPLQPHHTSAALSNPSASAQKRRVPGPDPSPITPYSPTIPVTQNPLPGMFASRPIPHHNPQPPALPLPVAPHAPTHHQSNSRHPPSQLQPPSQSISLHSPQPYISQPITNHNPPISNQTIQPGHTNPVQHPHVINHPSNNPASSMRIDFPPVAVPPPASHNIPPFNTTQNPQSIPRQPPPALMGKIPSLSLIPTNGVASDRENNSFQNVKKENSIPVPGPIPSSALNSTASALPFANLSQRPTPILSAVATASLSHPNQGDDWTVFQGRSNNGTPVNMQVKLQNSLSLDSVVCCVRYSWDGKYLATGSNRAAHIFDSESGRLVATFGRDDGGEPNEIPAGPDSYVRAVCFSPNGNWLVTGAEDHVVKVWDVRLNKVEHVLAGHGTDIYSVDVSANSEFIISGSGDKKAKLWNLETGKLMRTLGGENGPTDGITSVSVSPTSQHVAAGSLDKIVRVWDVESGRLVRQFEGHQDSVYSVAFSPDGRLVLSGSLDKTLKLWDLAVSPASNQCRLTYPGHKDFVLSVAFSPNGKWLISGSKDRSVQFWDPRQPAMCLMLHGHKNSVISIAHSPTNKALATGSGDCRARTWVYAPS